MFRIALLILITLTSCVFQKELQNQTLIEIKKIEKSDVELATKHFNTYLTRMSQNSSYNGTFNPIEATCYAISAGMSRYDMHGAMICDQNPPCTAAKDKGMFGVYIQRDKGGLFVSRISEYSSALNADIRIGDFILALNEEYVTHMTSKELKDAMACSSGNTLSLTIVRNGKDIFQKTIERRSIIPHYNSTHLIGSRIGYISIKKLEEEIDFDGIHMSLFSGVNIDTYIIDLRSMVGGTFWLGETFMSAFLPPNKKIATSGPYTYTTLSIASPLEGKIIVLTNRFTASLGEIIALLLREHRDALIIGETTRGYGTSLKPEDLGTMGTLLYSNAFWFSSLGTNINGVGLAPDIFVEETNPTAQFTKRPSIRDAILERALLEATPRLKYARAR